MAYDKFLIAPFESGLVNNLPPWQTPEDSFQELNNAYVWRGRIKKRFGSRYIGLTALNSRFRINLGNTGSGQFPAGTLSGIVPGKIWKIGQMFSIGSNIYTAYQTNGPMLVTGGTAITYTYNTVTGAYNFIGETNGVPVYFYPAEPVMGLCDWENGAVNNHPAFGFDTQFVYEFVGGAWQLSTDPADPFHGSNSQFFWTCNWLDLSLTTPYLVISNFNATIGTPGANDDLMLYWNGSTWTDFTPIYQAAGSAVMMAKIILQFKDRMILLNTIEWDVATDLNVAHPTRCRYSVNGNPFQANSWLEINETGYQGAGWIDAPTDEAIIGAEFIKDRLLVYFERSTWELAHTGSPKPPLMWQKLNSELGTQSTNSTVVFDKIVLSVGSTGIHACNAVNVERVDDKIPADVFNLRIANQGISRVAGIRDYQTELVYWTWPEFVQPPNSDIYPKKVLVYNYKNGTWAYNDDVFTAFGYFEQQVALTWGNIVWKWREWMNSWQTGVQQAQSRRIIAGNQQGFVVIIDPDLTQNEQAMQVTNAVLNGNEMILTIVDHTLQEGDYIYIPTLNGIVIAGTGIYQVTGTTDYNTVTVDITDLVPVGIYTGGSTAARVSQIDIISKQWNPYLEQGNNFYLGKIDFCVVSTQSGQIEVDYAPSSTNISMIGEATATDSLLGTGILETSPYALLPLEKVQERLWHSLYFQTQGDGITIEIMLNDQQMKNPAIAFSPFELQGVLLHTKPTSSRLE